MSKLFSRRKGGRKHHSLTLLRYIFLTRELMVVVRTCKTGWPFVKLIVGVEGIYRVFFIECLFWIINSGLIFWFLRHMSLIKMRAVAGNFTLISWLYTSQLSVSFPSFSKIRADLLHKQNDQEITIWNIAMKCPKTTKNEYQCHILPKWDKLRPFEGLKSHFRTKMKISFFGDVLKNGRKNWTFKFHTLQTLTKFNSKC